MNKLVWKNIYHMLCYCVDELKYFDEGMIDKEEIGGTNELLAMLLMKAFDDVSSGGYIKRYRRETIVTDQPCGIFNIPASYMTGAMASGKMVCEVDILDSNNKINQIIKAAFNILIDSSYTSEDKISKDSVSLLNMYLNELDYVDDIEIDNNILDDIGEIPEYYEPVLFICEIIIKDWLSSDDNGTKFIDLSNRDRLCYIWEKFVRNLLTEEYYCEYNVDKPVYAMSNNKSTNPDIVIYNDTNKNVVVLDCKWYEKSRKSSDNMYQAIAYGDVVWGEFRKNNIDKEVFSILLYACDSSTEMTDIRDKESNNSRFIVEEWQVNVNQEFNDIKRDIKGIVTNRLCSE